MQHHPPFAQPQTRHPRRQGGASLIEVLVAILLLSVGMLAMVGINAAALRYTKVSQFRTTASDIAATFAESVRANVTGAMAGGYTFAAPENAPANPGFDCGAGPACTAAQVAQLDMYLIRQQAANSLNGGDIITAFTPDPDAPTLRLWVIWAGPENSTDAADAAAWQQTEEACPAAARDLVPRRQCMQFDITL